MALNGTMVAIQTVTVGSGGTTAFDFQNIPATYTDLKIVISGRGDLANVVTYAVVEFNGVSTNRSGRLLAGEGSGTPYSVNYPSDIFFQVCGASNTSSTFGNTEIYIPNYAGSTNKSISIDAVTENNGTFATNNFFAGLWSNTSAINRVTISAADATLAKNKLFVQHSTATLYGITRVPAGAKATGGVIYDDSSFWYHVFTSSGTFTPSQNLTCDYLVIAGGGGGSSYGGSGGGGAGGLRSSVTATGGGGALQSAISVTPQNYTITVGAGGAGQFGSTSAVQGNSSSFSTISTTGGGRGAGWNGSSHVAAGSGGSGGGGNYVSVTSGGAGTSNEGYAGGTGNNPGAGNANGGGGGGAGAVGGNANTGAGDGGIGVQITALATPTFTGTNSGYYAGGGGGATYVGTNGGTGGLGGGGNGATNGNLGTSGIANTGGGGGASSTTASPPTVQGGNGGSGIVIVRYAK